MMKALTVNKAVFDATFLTLDKSLVWFKHQSRMKALVNRMALSEDITYTRYLSMKQEIEKDYIKESYEAEVIWLRACNKVIYALKDAGKDTKEWMQKRMQSLRICAKWKRLAKKRGVNLKENM